MVPLNRQFLIPDLMKRLGFPVLLVARSGLGTINHTMMSIMTLNHYRIDLWGVVLNGPFHPSNEDAIRHFGPVKNLYSFPQLGSVTPKSLESAFLKTFNHHAS
jgi:dethiobiotin synthetase/malonyl-CoA O-methyltransferase